MPEDDAGRLARLVRNVPGGFPPANERIGLSVSRSDLPGGLDFLDMRLSGHEFPPHVHEGYTFGLVIEGVFEYWCAGRVRVIGPGELILMNPGEVHTGRARPGSGGVQYQVIYPRTTLVERLVGLAPPLVRFEASAPGLVGAFRRIASLAGRTDRAAELKLGASLSELVAGLGAAQAGSYGCRRRHLADLVRVHLQGSLRTRPALGKLAERLGVHPGYLRRVFQEVMGLSPRSYLLQLRVMRARQLLGKGVSIAEAGWAAGFTDQAHLTHAFKRTMGFSPGRFRRELGYGQSRSIGLGVSGRSERSGAAAAGIRPRGTAACSD